MTRRLFLCTAAALAASLPAWTPDQVHAAPATAFVHAFVGEASRVPGGLRVRPHGVEIMTSGGDAVLVDTVFRKGGSWRVEGTPTGGEVVEIDVAAARPASVPGTTVLVRPIPSNRINANGAQR